MQECTVSVQAGVLIQIFLNSSFRNKTLLLGSEDSWEKPLNLDPCKPSQTSGAYEGPDIFAVYFYL